MEVLVAPCIIFEDEHLLVINKPAGLNTHAPNPYASEGIYEWLRSREPRWSKLAIIHRLDKETSGVMVFSKSSVANKALTGQFATRKVRKKYVFLATVKPRVPKLQVQSIIVRLGERYASKAGAVGGARAETAFEVLAPGKRQTTDLIGAMPPDAGPALFTILAEPFTGRTHQIRLHASENGFPILGDVLYGGQAGPRLYLHAAELGIRHPVTGREMLFCARADFAAEPHQQLRAAVIDSHQTDAFRLIHGASERWPGWYLDKVGPYLLSQSDRPLAAAQREEAERLAAKSGCQGVYHKVLTRKVRQAQPQETAPKLASGKLAEQPFLITENGLRFEISFSEGYSTGLFLDQRENRRRLLTGYVAPGFNLPFQPGRDCSLLNTFAYTCGFSVAAAARAHTTSLDLSKKYLEWGRRNFEHNGFAPEQHDFIFGDVFDWLSRFAKKQRTFDLVLLDPPTFSQSRETGVFQAERHYGRLLALAAAVTRKGGVLFASTNAAGWPPEKFVQTAETALHSAGRRIVKRQYFPQPPDFPASRAESPYLKTLWLELD